MKWFCKLFRPRPPYRIEIFPNKRHGWQWRIRHQNGEVLASSEEYSSHAAAWSTAEVLSGWTGWNLDDGVA